MRVHFDRSEMEASREELERDLNGVAEKFQMETHLTYGEDRTKMAIMVSKYDHCLYDLLLRHQYQEIEADIAVVVSNHGELESVAASFKVPFYHVPVQKGTQAEAEEKTLKLFDEYGVDFVVLARYMQILTGLMVEAYPSSIINVHHGFLSAFQGAKPYHQAYERGVKLIGATSHYVTVQLDCGPIIEQETVRVNHTHSANELLAVGRDIEKRVLARAVRWHVEDRIMVYGNRTIVFD